MKHTEIESFVYKTLKSEKGLTTKKAILNACKNNSYTQGKGRNKLTLFNEIQTNEGFSIVYVSNPNFMQGAWNGGGRGVFAKLQLCGMVKTIRLIQD